MSVDFLSGFPGQKPRETQVKVLTELAEKWDDYNVFVLDVPTGGGKSHCAVSIGKQFNSYLLTESKSLQDQYLREFPLYVKSLKGKNNYPCVKNDLYTVESSPCQVNNVFVKRCRENTVCTYYKARTDAKESKIFLTNYNYFVLFAGNQRESNKRPVIICDEGHVLSEKLADMAKISINLQWLTRQFSIDDLEDVHFYETDDVEDTKKSLKVIQRSLLSKRVNYYQNVSELLGLLMDIDETMSTDELTKTFEDAIARKNIAVESLGKVVNETIKTIKMLDNQLTKIEFFFEFSDDIWVFDPDDTGRKIVITPIDSRRVFKQSLLPFCDKVVLMSASIGSVASLAEELGIEEKEICYISCDSPFNPALAPIHVMADYDFSFKGMDHSLPTALETIDAILDVYADTKGIIHAGNYKITNYILKNSKHSKRLIGKATDDPTSNEMLFEKHSMSDKPTVLVSPSMHTGIDLKGDLSGFQIIVKFPFSSLADKRTKLKMNTSNTWYANETWKKIIQASGRSTRTETDSAPTFVLDKAFHYQFKLFRKHLPKWFKERIDLGDD